jgi:hypothetical protein
MAKKPSTKSDGQRVHEAIQAQYPDVYMCPGLGYCGPDWQKAEALRLALMSGPCSK